MVRRDDTLLTPPVEQALHGVVRQTDLPADEAGISLTPSNHPVDGIVVAEILVGDVALLGTQFVEVDVVTNSWIFNTEIMIEYSRRRERQFALSRLWTRLTRLVHPELVSQVRIIHERRAVRAEFQIHLAPEIYHEAALRAMERSIRSREHIPQSLRPPMLVRQYAQDVISMNGRNPRDSQIGSSHGEISETDDLADATNAFHTRQRKASNTNRHRATPGAQGNPTSFGPMPVVQAVAHPQLDAPKATVRRYVVRSEIDGALYTADNKLHFSGEAVGDIVFVDAHPVVAKSAIHVLEKGYGWYTLSSDDSKNKTPYVPQPASREEELPAYRCKDDDGNMVSYPARKYQVYEPFYVKLKVFLPKDSPDEPLRKAVSALRQKVEVPPEGELLLASTGQYFLASMHYLNALANDNEMAQRCTGARGVGAMEFSRNSIIGVLGIDQDFVVSRRVEAKACHIPNDWAVRNDIVVLKSESVVDANGAPIPTGELVEHPYWVSGNMRSPYVSTCYFELQAPNLVPFVEYDKCDASLSRGCKRLMGARDDELRLRENNLALGQEIRDSLTGRSFTCVSVGAVCRDVLDGLWSSDVAKVHTKLLANRRHGHHVGDMKECQVFVAAGISETVGRCDRTRLQKFIDGLMNGTRWAYLGLVLGFLTVFRALLAREACAEIPHVKQKLRSRYVNQHVFSTSETMVGKNDVLSVNLKRETAKDGKAPRLTVDYKAGCMYANELPEYVKVCLDGQELFQLGEYTLLVYIVAKPKSDSLEKAFENLDKYWRSSKILYAVIYSDDMCISGLGEAYNVDISSCDSGQDVSAFLAMYAAMRRFHRQHSEGLIDQCMLPMDIRGEDGKSRLRIKFKGPFLGSGTVLTTPLNHFASLMIALSILFWVSRGSALAEAVVKGAEAVGHKVTCEVVEVLEDFQFLKKSCTKKRVSIGCKGGQKYKYVVFTNRACMLRNLGKIWETIQPRHLGIGKLEFDRLTVAERADRFFSAVVAGWKHEPSCPILSALRRRFSSEVIPGLEVLPDSIKYLFTDYADYSGFDVSEGVIRRYRLQSYQIDELVSKIDNIRLGHRAVCSALQPIYSADYGCGPFSWDEHDHGLVGRSYELEERTIWSS